MLTFSFRSIQTYLGFIFVLLHCLANPAWAAPQNNLVAKIKAGYVFKFIEYVEWPNEAQIKTFDIGFYGNDSAYYQALLSLHNVRFRGFRVNVWRLSSAVSSKPLQMLIIDEEKSTKLAVITARFKTQPTLMISDMAADKKNTMLNFVRTPDDTLSFELNRYNMLNVGLKVSPDILVLGGSELDIANVLKEMDHRLTSSLTELKLQSDKLVALQHEIKKREQKLHQQQLKLAARTQQLQQQSDELRLNKNKFTRLKHDYKQLSSELTNSRRQLSQNVTNLDHLKNEIKDKEEAIVSLSTQIVQRKVDLRVLQLKQQLKLQQQQQEIAAKKIEISTNLAAIEQQSSVIRTQYSALILAAVGFAFALLMAVVVWQVSRTKHSANLALKDHNLQLAELNLQLKVTQNQLVESEKMAALGELVAGVAHEINTPLGVSITAASYLSDQIGAFNREYAEGNLKRAALDTLLVHAKESSDMLTRNLERASQLVGTFKQVAVDQSGEDMRPFELKIYLEELVQSLRPQLKQGHHQIVIQAAEKIDLNSYPGVFAQILTNLIMNSVVHGFKGKNGGMINIVLTQSDAQVMIEYRDDGSGLNSAQREKVFEPFYTTARGTGGTGLGMSISYNLVVSKLGGAIRCIDSPLGAHFHITFPAFLTGAALRVDAEASA